jgi:hypothetical protein
MTSVVPQHSQKEVGLQPLPHFEPRLLFLSTFSVPRKQLFSQIPIRAFSNAIALGKFSVLRRNIS